MVAVERSMFARQTLSSVLTAVDRSNIVLGVLRLLKKGSEAAVQAGEELLYAGEVLDGVKLAQAQGRQSRSNRLLEFLRINRL